MINPTIAGLLVIIGYVVITYLLGSIVKRLLDNPDAETFTSGMIVEGILISIAAVTWFILYFATYIGTGILGKG